MDIKNALSAFQSLSQETRLRAFRLLIKYGMSGCAATVLSEKLGVPQNTLSFHLSHLSHAGLVTSKREGRSIIYFAVLEQIEDLMNFMAENCCISADADCLTPSRLQNKKNC